MEKDIENTYIYLDHAATTPLDPIVFSEMIPYLQNYYGNASSMHGIGRFSRKAIESARQRIAQCIGAQPEEIIFTGSGTEADNIAIIGTAMKMKRYGKHVITTTIEHPAVRNCFRKLQIEGFEVSYLSVDSEGRISVDEFKRLIRKDTILVSIMYANNEIGSIQPIQDIAEITNQHGIIFHTDAVQAFGKLPINVQNEKFDLLSASAHKIYGPKGIGMLYIRNRGRNPKRGVYIIPITYGGGQEFGFRSATENVANIIGFAKAVELCYENMDKIEARLKNMRDDLIKWILTNIPGSFINGGLNHRLPNNINVGFEGIQGTDLLKKLDQEKIAVSVGSACHSKSQDVSFVLTAIGLSEELAASSIRLTLGKNTTNAQLEYVKNTLKRCVEELRLKNK
ncbi:MAG: cysteine desulfurase [Candidatus Lokiarchaeota archaeon]|nr:cysteine desulfurase [Candidatus Harpocratesius repetitus]